MTIEPVANSGEGEFRSVVKFESKGIKKAFNPFAATVAYGTTRTSLLFFMKNMLAPGQSAIKKMSDFFFFF